MVFNSTPAKSGVTQPATRQFKNNRRSFAIVPKKVNEIQENIVGGSLIYTGLRVAAQMNSAPKDIIHQEWTKQQGGRIVTPFSRPLTRCVLHYEDPTIGYHFSMAYTGLLEDSMLKTDATKVKQMGTCFSLAFEQWQSVHSPRRSKSQHHIWLYTVVMDAMAFCHTLQHIQFHKDSNSTG